MKRIVFIFFFFFSSAIYSQSFSSKIEEVLTDSLFDVSQIAIDVYDLSEEKYLFRKNENLVLRPASNMKLLTTGAALLYLGVDEEFETVFISNGSIVDSTLNGDLTVIGGFDPFFSEVDIDTVVQKIKLLGITEINGNLKADVSNIDSLYFGKGWMWDDNPESFMPYLTSLNIERNVLKIYFSPGKVGENVQIRLKPNTNFFNIENNLITTAEDTSNFKISRDWLHNKNDISLQGNISYNHPLDSAKNNFVNPPSFFLELLKEKLLNEGISISGNLIISPATENCDTLLSVKRTILETVIKTNKDSENLAAEMLLRKLSHKYFAGSASAKKGLYLIDSLVVTLGYNPKSFTFADGSGLSHYNLISASLIVDLLKYMYFEQPEFYGYLYDSLPIAGVDGTLERRMKNGNAFSNLRAKTGTISGVSALSGYVRAKNGNMLAFSILIQNYSGSAKSARLIQNKLANILADIE